jgi:hypothetical protein
MTIKKIALSVAAIALTATASYAAGTLSVNGGVMQASSELLETTDINATLSTQSLTYTCGMSASTATEPGFELKFPTATPISVDDKISIIDGETNATVAVYDRIDGNSVIFSTSTGATVQRNKTYKVVATDDNASISSSLKITLAEGSSSADAQLILYSNSGDSTLDTASDTIVEAVTQFTGSFGTLLDAQIDASADFLLFNADGSRADSTTKDSFTFTFGNDKDIDFTATSSDVTYTVLSDVNLSTYTITGADTAGTNTKTGSFVADNGFDDIHVNDMNITIDDTGSTANANGDVNGTITKDIQLTVAPTADMAVVNFTAQAVVTFDGGATKTLFSGTDAGNWTIYGYTAQIPNVAGLSTHDTTMKFTNRSTLDTNIYFTLIDPDGTTATLNSSANTELSALAAGVTGTYKASDLLALVTDADFDKTGSFSVEVSIPTTPSSVYGAASFKNKTLGQFKDLPVYNSSSMGY